MAPDGDFTLAPTGSGPLDGLTFAIKDLFDVAGRVTGCGNPDWLRTHRPGHGACGERRKAARCRRPGHRQAPSPTNWPSASTGGISITARRGIPRHLTAFRAVPRRDQPRRWRAAPAILRWAPIPAVRCASRRPSTASSAFAPATAWSMTAASWRLAKSLDTVGWFARNADLLARDRRRAAASQMPARRPSSARSIWRAMPGRWRTRRWRRAAAAGEGTRRCCHRPGHRYDRWPPIAVACSVWRQTFRFLQMREIWAEHGAWIERESPRFGPEIAERFAMSQEAAGEDRYRRSGAAPDHHLRASMTCWRRMASSIIPTAADIAPLKSMASARIAQAFATGR